MGVYYKSENEETLVKQHTPLVVSIAFSFNPRPPYDYDDLVSIGLIGLLKAIRAYDPKRGTQFSTLASTVIRREIVRELEKTNGRVHESLEFDIENQVEAHLEDYLPENLTDTEKKILIYRFHEGFTFKEIGEKLGYTKQWANNKLNNILNKILKSNGRKKKKNTVAKRG